MKKITKKLMPFRSRRQNIVAAALVFGLIGVIVIGLSHAGSDDFSNVNNDPIDPAYLKDIGFGARSFWIQPWRAYMDTMPATTLVNAVGVNFNVNPKQVDPTARLLAANGFKRVRIEVGWSSMNYDDPTQMNPTNAQGLQNKIASFKKYGIRPLILFNANDEGPVPSKPFTVNVIQAAHGPIKNADGTTTPGDTTIKVDQNTLQQIKLNYSGSDFCYPDTATKKTVCTQKVEPQDKFRFIKTASDGTITLSRPLMADVPAGSYIGATQRFLPFYPQTKLDGTPSPEFNETMNGWLEYVGAVTKVVKQAYGSDDFDVEVWNELGFGSAFLNYDTYYSPVPAGYPDAKLPDNGAILTNTVNYLHNPANGVPDVQVGNGFANEAPWGDGGNSPVGLNAIDKHPYSSGVEQPPTKVAQIGSRPIDATGQRDSSAVYGCWQKSDNSQPAPYTDTNHNGKYDSGEPCNGGCLLNAPGCIGYNDPNEPAFNSFMPERFLTALHTETLIRDLAPIPNRIYTSSNPQCNSPNPPTFDIVCGNVHGRYSKPCLSCNPPTMWITEVNLGPQTGNVFDPANPSVTNFPPMTTEEARHISTKDYLRYLTTYVNKGVSAIDFYAVSGGSLSVVDPSFFDQLNANIASKASDPYPGDNTGGDSLNAIKNLTDIMKQDAAPITQTRALTLTKIADNHNHYQFKGDGTPQHPPLYDRDVLAVLPFQVNDHRFAIPAYVMTQNVDKIYNPNAPTDGSRFDMPPEAFQLTMGGFSTTGNISVQAIDPLNNTSTPVSIVSRNGDTLVIQADLTDSPRVIIVDESGGAGQPPDTTPPVVSLTAPAANATVSGNAVTIAANATDNVGVVGVQFKLDDNNLGSEITTSPYSTTWDTTGVANGTHTLTALARDAAGNSTTATTVTVAINNPSSSCPQLPCNTDDPKRADISGPEGKPDGNVDIYDVSFVIQHYGTKTGDAKFDLKADITGPDSKPDGQVDLSDLSYIIRNYGKTGLGTGP